jgi:copper homeostasis protein
MDALLEIIALHVRDAEAAQAGGADRIEVCARMDLDGMSPDPSEVRALVRACDIPARVMLRLSEGFGTTGGELARLQGLAGDYLGAGAEGVVFGFLSRDLDIDIEACEQLAGALDGRPWTFHRAIDHALSVRRAWRAVLSLPGLDTVLTAGSALGVEHGQQDLCDLAVADGQVAHLVMAGGGLRAEHVPWLLRAGIRKFHVGSSVRPGGSWDKAHVDPDYVRSWRTLLDDHARRLRPA